MPQTEYRFPPNGEAYRVTVGCSFDVKDEGLIPVALDKIEQALTAASAEHCEGWLVMLQAATARRADSDATSAVSYSLYAAELRQWPADVAKAACERLARGRPGQTDTNWFPTLAELVRECEQLASNRRAIYVSLQRYTRPKDPPRTDRRYREPTAEDKARVSKMADDTLAELRAMGERHRAARRAAEKPSTAGKPDAGGITPEMRALLARQRGGDAA